MYATNKSVDIVDHGQFNKEQKVDFAPGTCILVKASVFKELGFFDEQYYLYLEDTDFAVRAKRRGHEIVVNPKAIIWHKVAASSAIGGALNDYFITRNRILFGMRYANLRARIALGRQALGLLIKGRPWQKRGVVDAFSGNYAKGSWK